MRGRIVAITLVSLGMLALAVFLAWAIYMVGRGGGGWGGLGPVWPYVAGAAVVTGALTAVFMWLAFYSSKRGYDDRVADAAGELPEPPGPAAARPRSGSPASPSRTADPPRK
jgi:uncharacterized RDD family membrane protein YckC